MARGGVDPRDSKRMDLVQRRRDDSVSSVEEIQRDFAPGDGGYIRKKTTVRQGVRPARRARSAGRYDDGYYDDRRSDYSRRSRRHDDDERRKSFEATPQNSVLTILRLPEISPPGRPLRLLLVFFSLPLPLPFPWPNRLCG